MVSWLGKKAEPSSHNPSNTDIPRFLGDEPERLRAIQHGQAPGMTVGHLIGQSDLVPEVSPTALFCILHASQSSI
jgi:hypothetical protein